MHWHKRKKEKEKGRILISYGSSDNLKQLIPCYLLTTAEISMAKDKFCVSPTKLTETHILTQT